MSEWFVSSSVSARIITVAAGAPLQQAINAARDGDVLALENGAVFTGNFTLPLRPTPSERATAPNDASGMVVIRPARPEGLPVAGARLQPSTARSLPRIHSPNGAPAVRTGPGARGWRLELIEFTAAAGGPGDIIALGDGSSAQSQRSQVPRDLILDRVYVHGDATLGQKRCIALNSAETTITGSYVAECKAEGQDAQAVAGWNGPGPFTITNNYLEGAGENIMFGGGDPSIDGLVPSDILIAGNTIEKPLAWRNSKWQVKNLVELKNARRVVIRNNVIRHNWQAAQSGYAVLFTVRNQDGRCPWCQVEQVTFEQNRLEKIAGGISILGRDDEHPSQQTQEIIIRDNLVSELDNQVWGGSGYFLLLLGGPRAVTVSHNTIVQPHASGLIQLEGLPVQSFVFTSNVARHGEYGIIGTGRGPGRDSIDAYLPSARIAGNIIAGADAGRYPPGNQYPGVAELDRRFADPRSGDFRLAQPSSLATTATTPTTPATTKGRSRANDSTERPPGADLSAIPPSAPQ